MVYDPPSSEPNPETGLQTISIMGRVDQTKSAYMMVRGESKVHCDTMFAII